MEELVVFHFYLITKYIPTHLQEDIYFYKSMHSKTDKL